MIWSDPLHVASPLRIQLIWSLRRLNWLHQQTALWLFTQITCEFMGHGETTVRGRSWRHLAHDPTAQQLWSLILLTRYFTIRITPSAPSLQWVTHREYKLHSSNRPGWTQLWNWALTKAASFTAFSLSISAKAPAFTTISSSRARVLQQLGSKFIPVTSDSLDIFLASCSSELNLIPGTIWDCTTVHFNMSYSGMAKCISLEIQGLNATCTRLHRKYTRFWN